MRVPTGLKLIMFTPPGPVREAESTVPPVVLQVTVCVPSLADTTLILTDAAVTKKKYNDKNYYHTSTNTHNIIGIINNNYNKKYFFI